MNFNRSIQLVVVGALLVSCNSAVQQEQGKERRMLLAQVDSLKTTGEHGYFIATYLVGRYNTRRFYKMPINIVVQRLQADLTDVPFGLEIIDSTTYKVVVPRNGTAVSMIGEFGKPLVTPEFEWIMDLEAFMAASLEANKQVAKMTTAFSYEFRVFPY